MTSEIARPAAGPATTSGEPRTRATTESGQTSTFEFEPHNCFACGTLNKHGLQLNLHLGERRSWAELSLADTFEGWVGIAHGGIVATILDEVMAWSLVAEDNWGVTARMSIEYRKPIRVGGTIRAEGWVVRSRKRIVETAAQIVDPAGTVLATAEGTYLAADPERKRELQARYGYRVAAARRESAPGQDGIGATSTDPSAGSSAGGANAGGTPDRVDPQAGVER